MPGTVTVGCRLPHGLMLQAQVKRTRNEPVMGGGTREVEYWDKVGRTVKINGFATPADKAPLHQIVGGFGLTHGVDADFFSAWMAQNKDHPAVEGGFIFAAAKPDGAEGEARDKSRHLSGFEPTDPTNLPGEFRRSVATADVR